MRWLGCGCAARGITVPDNDAARIDASCAGGAKTAPAAGRQGTAIRNMEAGVGIEPAYTAFECPTGQAAVHGFMGRERCHGVRTGIGFGHGVVAPSKRSPAR